MSEAQLRQLMLGLEPPNPQQQQQCGGAPPPPGMEGLGEDPMMKLMQQMMGGAFPGAGGPGGANPFAGTAMEGLFNAAAAGGAGPQAQQEAASAAADTTANTWRIVHAVFALGLGLYAALSTTFTGTQRERDLDELTAASPFGATRGADDDLQHQRSLEQTRAYFFYVFTSVEAVLLTSRYFLAKGSAQAGGGGMLWTISGLLPPGNLQSGLRHVLRYADMFSTVRGDALLCVFVLGVCCWLRS
jgi:GET complex subunit GET2